MNMIKKYIKDHKKLIIFSLFLIVFVAGCSSPRNADGTVDKEQLIFLSTPYLKSIGDGWFNIFVWPMAQMINWVATFSDAGVGIIVTTIIVNVITAAFTIKQQAQTQKMQMIQGEQAKIQAKYEGKTDQASKMRMSQELQMLYKKHDINPMGSIVTLFIQLPIMIGIYQACMRASSVYTGSFFGIDLTMTPQAAIGEMEIPVIVIFLLMAVMQFVSFKIPQILAKRRNEKNRKIKKYAQPEKKGMAGNMNMMMYVSVAMMVFLGFSWPLGMTFYLLVSSCVRVIQNIVIDKFFIKD
ncbi:YidC/Oxa1 family membrane protein insertase [Breznakia blatticola]|uniref:YidC/Oxa1 family membrane protein insertase n=1 Tax=Breznakia blatticola TaxID=1754012 RepID=A0A4R7ZCK0_9FIRM|nr:YidC/Oxa1 family membrane protein insertase [Breznakia blatticola]TDW13194.1 YidC/Oxa1 family membrane protein insertase [Breznakia blatticola]